MATASLVDSGEETQALKHEIRKHYDVMSPYYRSLWGEHIHHGYWISGRETNEQAQIQLIEHVARAARLQPGRRVLDVGCGLGGSSIYLAKRYQADVTGITISPVQVEMANATAVAERVAANFLLMDAESMEFGQAFDLIWSLEAISHCRNLPRVFASAAALLKPNGTLALTDWLRKEDLTLREHKKFIEPIEKSMLVRLETIEEYRRLLRANGLEVQIAEVMNERCAKTWDLGLGIIKDKKLWTLAAELGPAFIEFLRGFRAMRAGFHSGAFIYGMLIATKA
jgi:cyclopropane fatty-acyl-phospholipid synthase-like methyltransferase